MMCWLGGGACWPLCPGPPKDSLWMAQAASPLSIFLTDAGSFRCSGLDARSGRITTSIDSRDMRRRRTTWHWFSVCAISRKSSTYTLTATTSGRQPGPTAVRTGWVTRTALAAGGVVAVPACGWVSATGSNWCAVQKEPLPRFHSRAFARSHAVSVSMVKYGGDSSTHPIGRASGNALRGRRPGEVGRTTPSSLGILSTWSRTQ